MSQTSTLDLYSGQLGGKIKAWVNFNGTGTVAIRKSYNVSSITDNSVGNYTINFITAMPDTDYVTVGTCGGFSTGLMDTQGATRLGNRTTTTQIIAVTTGTSSAYTDVTAICVVVLR